VFKQTLEVQLAKVHSVSFFTQKDLTFLKYIHK